MLDRLTLCLISLGTLLHDTVNQRTLNLRAARDRGASALEYAILIGVAGGVAVLVGVALKNGVLAQTKKIPTK